MSFTDLKFMRYPFLANNCAQWVSGAVLCTRYPMCTAV